jgi:DNA modification methylase
MCPIKVCTTCGEPSRRIVDVDREYHREAKVPKVRNDSRNDGGAGPFNHTETRSTLGWSDCGHDSWRNGLVLDPFAGSGTTLAVATGHGRDAIGIDLDARSADLCAERVGMFLEVDEPAAGVA